MEENNQLKLVKQLMDKNKETLQTHKAETFIEIQGVKDQIMDELKKNSKSYEDLQKNIEVLETKLVKNNLGGSEPRTTRKRILAALKQNDFMDKIQKWDSRKGSNDFTAETKLIENQIVIHDPTSFVAGDAPVVLPYREMGVDKPPVRPLLVSDLIGDKTGLLIDL